MHWVSNKQQKRHAGTSACPVRRTINAQTGIHDSSRGPRSGDGPEFAATPGVAARGPKTGAAVCV